MNELPLISICIPAYKRIDFVTRLLDSISKQSFRDFEVVVTDDSPGAEVQQVCRQYQAEFPVFYHRNQHALGTPENWNQAMRKARGQWIKLMHDDDWFVHEHALRAFADATGSGKKFIFSAHYRYNLATGAQTPVQATRNQLRGILKQPLLLFASNIIGPPSVTLVHQTVGQTYDNRMKWLVDIDYYIKVLDYPFHFIPEKLVNIGMGEEQVTAKSFRNPQVELPESLMILEKYGSAPLKNIMVYDAWWRLLRNLGIRNLDQWQRYTGGKTWPGFIERMLAYQRLIPGSMLKTGFISKLAMTASYISNRASL